MLTRFDDYPIHQSGVPINQPISGDRNHYDRYFFNGYSRDGSLFFAAAMGLYPNRSVIDAHFSVVIDGVQTSIHASGRAPTEPSDTTCGPVRIEVIDPMRVLRVIVDPDEHGLGCDLTFTARSVAVEEAPFLRKNRTRVVMDYTRLTQFGSWSGTITTADGVVDVDESIVGSRDRSWGIRSVGEAEGGAPGRDMPQFFWLWAPINFDDGVAHFDVNETERGERWHETAIRMPLLSDGDPCDTAPIEAMKAVDWHIDWEPGTRRSRTASLTFHPWNQEPSTIVFEPILTFQMLGIGYFHPEFSHGHWKGETVSKLDTLLLDDLDPSAPQHIHVQQLVKATWGDRVGIGVLEQLAIGAHEPSGLTGLFDGFSTS